MVDYGFDVAGVVPTQIGREIVLRAKNLTDDRGESVRDFVHFAVLDIKLGPKEIRIGRMFSIDMK
jgi:hypothetical protein